MGIPLPIPADLRKVIEDVPHHTKEIVDRLDKVIGLLEEIAHPKNPTWIPVPGHPGWYMPRE